MNVRTPDMTKTHYLIGMGRSEAGPETYYYIEHDVSGPVLSLFTTVEKARRYITQTLNTPTAHISLLEGVDLAGPAAETILGNLTDGQYGVIPCDAEGLAMAMLTVGTRSIILDPGPGENPVLTSGG